LNYKNIPNCPPKKLKKGSDISLEQASCAEKNKNKKAAARRRKKEKRKRKKNRRNHREKGR
jgi:hypothetical protein